MNGVALRVDVDFRAGLLRAVPAMLDALAAHGMRASFFVVAGLNAPARSLARLFEAGYRRRVVRLGLWRLPELWREGAVPMLDGVAARESLARIEAEGHELVVHGWDHAWWARNAWSAPIEELVVQIDRAYEAIERAAGPRARAWGSPNWRTRDDVIAELVSRGVPYLSECWGHAPFASHGVPHLPVTDNLEPLALERGVSPGLVDEMLDARAADAYRLVCAHDYFEGLLHPELFDALLDGLARRGRRALTLAEAATRLDHGALESRSCARGPLRGFCGEVSIQSEEPAGVLTSRA